MNNFPFLAALFCPIINHAIKLLHSAFSPCKTFTAHAEPLIYKILPLLSHSAMILLAAGGIFSRVCGWSLCKSARIALTRRGCQGTRHHIPISLPATRADYVLRPFLCVSMVMTTHSCRHEKNLLNIRHEMAQMVHQRGKFCPVFLTKLQICFCCGK